MKTFEQFVQDQQVDPIREAVLQQMVEMDVDPWDFLAKMYKEVPGVELALAEARANWELQKQQLMDEGFFGRLAQVGKDAASGLKHWGQGAVQNTKKNLQQFGAHARDVMAGPLAKYQDASKALDALMGEIGKNQRVQQLAQTKPQLANLTNTLGQIKQQLDQQAQEVGSLLGQDHRAGYSVPQKYDYGAAKTPSAAAVAPAAGQQQPAAPAAATETMPPPADPAAAQQPVAAPARRQRARRASAAQQQPLPGMHGQ